MIDYRKERVRSPEWDAQLLFWSIEDSLGKSEAKRIFKEVAKYSDDDAFLRSRGWQDFVGNWLLIIYDKMEPKSVPDLWRYAKEQGLCPRGPQTLAAFERHFTRLRAKERRWMARVRAKRAERLVREGAKQG